MRSIKDFFYFFVLDLLSFGSPQAIVINITVILLILFFLPTHSLQSGPDISVYRNVIPLIIKNCPASGIFANCDMPSYGMTRGISRLLHGDFSGAYAFNRGVFILFGIMVSLIIYNGAKVIRIYKKTGKWYEVEKKNNHK